MLERAHRHSTSHRQELERSKICGCFYCSQNFMVAKIEEWIDDSAGTALCPECGIDSVIGSASGYPVDDRDFLEAMHELWFS
ncbi:cytoplasmic protein [Labrys sp. LIt4]|nr:cytoplasmic protein [Labrys sp. LIt4]